MSGNVIHGGTWISCPHGGRAEAPASASSAAAEPRVDGLPVATADLVHTVTGCTHTVDSVPMPCTSVRWTADVGDGVRVDGVPVLLTSTDGQCFGAGMVPQGRPLVSTTPQGVFCR